METPRCNFAVWMMTLSARLIEGKGRFLPSLYRLLVSSGRGSFVDSELKILGASVLLPFDSVRKSFLLSAMWKVQMEVYRQQYLLL